MVELNLVYSLPLNMQRLVQWSVSSINQSISQSIFYFMSVHIEVILDIKKNI